MLKFSMEKTPEEDGFTKFNNYFHFIRNLGHGSFGKVVLAEDKQLQEIVAVKVILGLSF
jgi:serine/threonine protein kinase